MTDITHEAAPRSDRGSGNLPDALRIILLAAPLLLVWIRVNPFLDLTTIETFTHSDAGNLANQIGFSVVGISAFMAIAHLGPWKLQPLLTRPVLYLAAWIALSVVLSQDVALSARRLLLFIIVSSIAVMLLLVPRSVQQFADVLAGVALLVLVVSYAGLVLVPQLAMHTAADLMEPEHAGAWRGVFPHKNEAGAAMVVFVMIGLFARSVGRRLLGTVVAALSAVFLVFTYSKTAILLLPVVLCATSACQVLRKPSVRLLLLLGPTMLLSVATVGSVFSPAVDQAVTAVLPDASFTGRKDIWDFAADHIAQKPITGWGFGAFWTESLSTRDNVMPNWVTQQSQAHNAYLEIVLCMGVPGLVLTLLAFVAGPLRDLQRTTADSSITPLAMLFLRLWMFGLTAGNFEAVLFDNTGPIFLMFLVSVFGLRYHAVARPVADG